MITPRDVQPLVETPLFQRLLKMSEAEPASRAHRALKGLERLARGVTREDDEREKLRRRHETKAPGSAPRRSLKESGSGVSEQVSV